MPRIIRNAIRCEKCGDIIESKTIHDFKCCSCGACAVDGGLIPDEMSGLRYQNDAHHRVFHCAEEV